MDVIKVNRLKLLETLKKNREDHASEYDLAVKGYWLQMEEGLAKALKEVRKHGKFVSSDPWRGIPHLPGGFPENHTRDYDTVITMLEFSVDDVIELDQQRFQQYVMDNWNWTGNVKSLNAHYANTLIAAGARK
jgi:hypothetical protein